MKDQMEFRTCPRCNKSLSKSDFVTEVCKRCDDVLEFGYPSFPAFKLDELDNGLEPRRMDLNEGWVLPSYVNK